ncbi:amino acid permease [Hoyosella sp. YIM 151337]|uniref:APC family permease n=1 Tax=Hoyosella sp. YIM 151337 TaxID=2992742 RepID=UPI0022361CFB|nr:amino acid permease [Hoyosella sp. YIM 151337]MCW4353082.1 amino acid permease [Hoyosella sp. YIM 151337]
MTPSDPQLARRLRLTDSVVVGLAAMIGAGIFAALAPAAAAAGQFLLIALAIAGVVAYCNANSSARLAAVYPSSGGAYVFGRERLGEFWGFLAGWGFVVGKTASCAAMALTVGAYAWPEHARIVAVITVIAVTAVNYAGVHKSARVARVIVGFVIAVLAVVVVLSFVEAGGPRLPEDLGTVGVAGVLQAAGLLFFAFAGYARIATLGEEVRNPAKTIPRAVAIALSVTLCLYALVAVAVLSVLGAEGLAAAPDPLARAVADYPGAEQLVRVGAVVAAAGALLSLILGVSRTTFAMARDGHLPGTLATVHPRFRVPHHAELAIGAVVIALVLLTDLRGAIGFSSFAVLTYYLIANASAWTLSSRPHTRLIPALGAGGCVVLAFTLPTASVAAGCTVLLLGAAIYRVRQRMRVN